MQRFKTVLSHTNRWQTNLKDSGFILGEKNKQTYSSNKFHVCLIISDHLLKWLIIFQWEYYTFKRLWDRSDPG